VAAAGERLPVAGFVASVLAQCGVDASAHLPSAPVLHGLLG
jgi:hypothetical protein